MDHLHRKATGTRRTAPRLKYAKQHTHRRLPLPKLRWCHPRLTVRRRLVRHGSVLVLCLQRDGARGRDPRPLPRDGDGRPREGHLRDDGDGEGGGRDVQCDYGLERCWVQVLGWAIHQDEGEAVVAAGVVARPHVQLFSIHP